MLPSFMFQIPRTFIGPGSIGNASTVINGLGAKKVLIVTDTGIVKAGLVDKVTSELQKNKVPFDVFDGCNPNAPWSNIEECRTKIVDGGFDLLIGVGGGSVMDIVKVASVIAVTNIAVQDITDTAKLGPRSMPKILIPTTSGTGSEWSRNAVITDETDGRKKLVRGDILSADAAIIDPEFTLELPRKITAETGIDALTHAIEGYCSIRTNRIGAMFSETAIKLISTYLPQAYARSGDIEARYYMSMAAALGMEALTLQGGGLAHLTDPFIVTKAHISHGEAVGILLPHVLRFNSLAVPERCARIAEFMGEKTGNLSLPDAVEKGIEAVNRLIRNVGLRQTLGEVGLTENDIAEIAGDVIKYSAPAIKINSPRDAGRDEVLQLLKAAL